ncbi:hypothetical protein [Sphaerospermopsis torques-reginae]|uniref:Uncharacterized protein n=1 Tax=Sphaerospermopsis torques-reginae ITEP-024 TaxID=984208 RepID=A0ABX8WZ51_9CYAN|nr:hypothetical protein [Sphaerospermopsis torques-reginae]QYX31693.1 hypothetical protein K2F26_23435 [Sphaerospermopsis torques-reginae ITEP-024]
MKCINCGTDNNLKDRTANYGRCKQCNHPFVFEPTTMGTLKITDPMFAKILADISANNTLYFTAKQLLYFLENRKNRIRLTASSVGGNIGSYILSNICVTGVFGGVTSGFLPNSFLVCNLIFQVITIIGLYQQTKSPFNSYTERKASAKSLKIVGILILLAGSLISFVIKSLPIMIAVIISGGSALFLSQQKIDPATSIKNLRVYLSSVEGWLTKWQEINGTIDKLLPSVQQIISEVDSISINPEVTAYSFDRLIVCDSANIAQLLIANNFHFENNCAILSVNGYPQSIFDTTMEMLRRNPNLQVFAFHDCSPKGVSLVHHLRNSETWFLNNDVTIIDVGLLPRQILANERGMFFQNATSLANKSKELPLEIRQILTAEELAWLDAGNFVELESFYPQILIKVLRNGISGSFNLTNDDSSMILIGDSGNDIYMVESFG